MSSRLVLAFAERTELFTIAYRWVDLALAGFQVTQELGTIFTEN